MRHAAALACILAAAPLPAVAQDYPTVPVLDAFRAACTGAEDLGRSAATIEGQGWTRLPANADTPVTNLLRQGEQALRDSGMGEPVPSSAFRHEVAGRELYLALSGADIDGTVINGCRIYDFASTAAPVPAELAAWAGREPTSPAGLPEGFAAYEWTPGLVPAHIDMQVFHAAPGTVPGPFTLSGLVLVASALGTQ